MLNETLWLRRIRNYAGLLGGLLPWICIFSVMLITNRHEKSLYSISATYYQSPALAGILTAASIVLMCYDGYSKIDSVVTTISGVFGIGIVLFPCSVEWLNSADKVGFFQVPMHYSNLIHCTCAAIFFILLAMNSIFLFTKTNEKEIMTNKKKQRNIVYRVCGIGMFVFIFWQAFTAWGDNFAGWWTMVNEIGMLTFFSVSWLAKGGAFPFLNDEACLMEITEKS